MYIMGGGISFHLHLLVSISKENPLDQEQSGFAKPSQDISFAIPKTRW